MFVVLLFVVQGIVIDDVAIVLDPDVMLGAPRTIAAAIVLVETVATVEEPTAFCA